MKLNYCFTTKVSTDAISDWSECLRKMRLVRDEAIRGQHTEEDYREFIQKAIFDAVMMRGETEMAFWEFDDPNTMPADARCDFVYLPTYLMVQMMVCGVNRHPRLLETSEVRSILEKGLNACAGRDLRGSGYDAMSILIENLKMFIDAGIVEFLADHSDVSPVFGKLFATCIAQLRKDLQTGSCVHDWNHNYSDEMYSVLELYKKHLTSKAPNVDECAHKEWIEAHLEDLQWILGMAHTGIRNTPCAGDHPANLLLHMLDCDVKGALKKKIERIVADPDSYLYFAYGSNMDMAQMAERCPGAKVLATAEVFDYRFAIDNCGVATILPKAGSIVQGVLWLVSKRNIASLDLYEGIPSGFYRKEILNVRVYDSLHNALVYLSNSACDDPGYRPEYAEKIIAAAKEHNLSKQYIDELCRTVSRE